MFRSEWLGVAVLLALTVAAREPAAPVESEPLYAVGCELRVDPRVDLPVAQDQASTLRQADAEYRRGESAQAAATIRRSTAIAFAPELATLAELYADFAGEQAAIADPLTSTTDRFVALRRAQALDIALGGAFADRLNARMHVVAPEAAVAYARVHDKLGAELAAHTAEMFE